jgi:hypothetical protein
MRRLFQAGLAGACFQAVAVGLATSCVAADIKFGFLAPGDGALGSEADLGPYSFSRILMGTYLLTALGIAITQSRFVEATAEHIRRASQAPNPQRPTEGAQVLSVQLWVAATGFAMIAFDEPPSLLVAAAREG